MLRFQANDLEVPMDAIAMLKQQHREVAALFKHLEKARSSKQRRDTFDEIADALAVHAAIEERHFYPAVREKATEDILRESVEEHLQIKRVIADLLALDAADAAFVAKAKVLHDDVEHHVEEEEKELFPKVQKLFDEETLELLAEAELKGEGNPRDAVPGETDKAAPL